jgi:hypothetical protein
MGPAVTTIEVVAITCCKMSMVGPLRAVLVGLTVATTMVEEDIDGGPLGGAAGGFGSVHYRG